MRTRVVALVLMAVAVVALAASTWASLARSDDLGTAVVGALVVLVVVAGVLVVAFRAAVRRTRARHRVLAARLPGWLLHEVWADRTLRAQLARSGRWVPRLRGGTRLTLGWSAQGVALWRDATADALAEVPWPAVVAVSPGGGSAAATSRPALVIDVVDDARLVVVPCARPEGGTLPASREAVAALVAAMRTARPQR